MKTRDENEAGRENKTELEESVEEELEEKPIWGETDVERNPCNYDKYGLLN